jgi:hypothetical protein
MIEWVVSGVEGSLIFGWNTSFYKGAQFAVAAQ